MAKRRNRLIWSDAMQARLSEVIAEINATAAPRFFGLPIKETLDWSKVIRVPQDTTDVGKTLAEAYANVPKVENEVIPVILGPSIARTHPLMRELQVEATQDGTRFQGRSVVEDMAEKHKRSTEYLKDIVEADAPPTTVDNAIADVHSACVACVSARDAWRVQSTRDQMEFQSSPSKRVVKAAKRIDEASAAFTRAVDALCEAVRKDEASRLSHAEPPKEDVMPDDGLPKVIPSSLYELGQRKNAPYSDTVDRLTDAYVQMQKSYWRAARALMHHALPGLLLDTLGEAEVKASQSALADAENEVFAYVADLCEMIPPKED